MEWWVPARPLGVICRLTQQKSTRTEKAARCKLRNRHFVSFNRPRDRRSHTSPRARMIQLPATPRIGRTAPERVEIPFSPNHDRLAFRTMVLASIKQSVKL